MFNSIFFCCKKKEEIPAIPANPIIPAIPANSIIPDRILDNYRINFESELNFISIKGKTYEGFRLNDNKRVAIKIIPKNQINKWTLKTINGHVSRVPFEVFSLYELKDLKNCIKIIEHEITDENVYIILELPQYLISLQRFMYKVHRNTKYYTDNMIFYILCIVYIFIGENFERNILNLDINCCIQVDPDDREKIKNIFITDFSSANNYCGYKTPINEYYGRIEYMPPDFVDNKIYTAETAKQWSLGILLYFMKYFEYPFQNENEIILKDQITEEISEQNKINKFLRMYFNIDMTDYEKKMTIFEFDNLYRAILKESELNGYELKNLKFKNSPLSLGTEIVSKTHVLYNYIDLKRVITKPNYFESFGRKMVEIRFYFFIPLKECFEILRENKLIIIMDSIDFEFELFNDVDFSNFNPEEIKSIFKNISQYLVVMRRKNIIYTDQSKIFINKLNKQVKLFYDYNIRHKNEYSNRLEYENEQIILLMNILNRMIIKNKFTEQFPENGKEMIRLSEQILSQSIESPILVTLNEIVNHNWLIQNPEFNDPED